MQDRLHAVFLSSLAALLAFTCTAPAAAHPVIENALDVVVEPTRVSIVAKIAAEEVLVVAVERGETLTTERFNQLMAEHGRYVLDHLTVEADGKKLTGREVAQELPGDSREIDQTTFEALRMRFTLEYPLSTPPARVTVKQSLLADVPGWTAPCVVRVRQSTDPEFKMALLTGEQAAVVECAWPKALPEETAEATGTQVNVSSIFGAYCWHGIHHILSGYDHLLFVSALVLATSRLWELVKVVTAFTVAHTLTLALSVFNVVSLSEHIVEPMIAASIVFVAVQNVFWPETSTGWIRLGAAFAFGLFHGLGFAGGLKETMAELPGVALVTALLAFSVGVEIGHQIVVLPLFAAMQTARRWRTATPRAWVSNYVARFGSCAIALGGVYFLYMTLM